MHPSLEQFQESVQRVRNLGSIHATLSALTTAALDSSDILRAQFVLVVSALDFYVHDLVRREMMAVAQGSRNQTQQFKTFQVSMSTVQTWLSNPSDLSALESEIRERHGWQSFQYPDKVAEAIRLISDKKLWEEVGAKLGMKPEDVKRRLTVIVKRRNQIAHEADIDPSAMGSRWPISEADVVDSIDFVERLVTAIHDKML